MRLLLYIMITVFLMLSGVYAEHPLKASGINETENAEAHSSQENVRPDDEQPLAIVRRYRPSVKLFPADRDVVLEAERAQRLYNADTLATETEGYAMVQFMDNSVARLQPNSLLIVTGEITEENTTAAVLALELGELFLNTEDDRSEYEVETPTAVAAVKGTEFVTKVHEDGSSDISVLSGEVEVMPRRGVEPQTINSGISARISESAVGVEQVAMETSETEEIRQRYARFDERTRPEILRIILQSEEDEGDMREINLRYFDVSEGNE